MDSFSSCQYFDDNSSFSPLFGSYNYQNDLNGLNFPLDEGSRDESADLNKINKEDELYPFNAIPFSIQSTCLISKTNNSPEFKNEIKLNEKIEQSPRIQFKKQENHNLIGIKIKRDDIRKKSCGRIKKGSDEIGFHTKYSEDNIIVKMKNYLFNSIKDLLNNSFIYPNLNQKPFLKLVKGKNQSIKRDVNLELLKTKLKDIFSEDISCKYSTKDKSNNIVLIQKIYEEQKETDIIQILELTFGELLNIFRGTVLPELQEKITHIHYIKEKFRCLPDYLKKITTEERKNGENEGNIQTHLDKIKELSMNFEEWFIKKRSRFSKIDYEF